MFVIYKGQKYKCKLIDIVKIVLIEIKLLLKRFGRLLKIIFQKSDVILYMLIICLWLLYAFITNGIDNRHSQNQESLFLTLWNLKNSMYSSVVIAFAIGGFNHIKDYKETIIKQHYIYVDTMRDFDEIIRAVDNTNIWIYFYPLYNRKCLEKTITYLQKNDIMVNKNTNEFLVAIDVIQERIANIEQEIKTGHLLIKDEETMNLYLSWAKKKIPKVVLNNDKKDFMELLDLLFEIVEQLRYIWRRDEKDDVAILLILRKYNENMIKDDFYLRMYLPDFDLKDLLNRNQ